MVAYSWLTNSLDTNDNRVRIVTFVAMGAMFLASLAIPGAFDEYGLPFAGSYFVVRAAHIVLYAYATDDADVQQAIRRLAGPILGESIVATGLGAEARGRREEDDRPRRRAAEACPAVALCGGIALYLLGHIAFRARVRAAAAPWTLSQWLAGR